MLTMSLFRSCLRNFNLVPTVKSSVRLLRNFSTKEIPDDGPIKFSTSGANKWKAATSRSGIREKRLWYEPIVVISSISVFLIYFCILREENDIDLELNTSLYKRVKGLEEVQLNIVLDHNTQHGLQTQDIIERLEQIKSEKE